MTEERQRIPPNQKVISNLPVLHVGAIPTFNPESWRFVVNGSVTHPVRLRYDELLRLPRVVRVSDFHCVEGWSRLDNRWEGVAFQTLSTLVQPLPVAKYVTVGCAGGYTTNLPLTELLTDEVLLAYRLDHEALKPEHGGPVRLVVPQRYAYKSAKWVQRMRFTPKQELGYWEKRGYSNSADPWKEERYA